MKNVTSILVVGQTPPPFGGQAILIKDLLDGQYNDIRLLHVRMDFSAEMDEVGKFKFTKLFKLVSIVSQIIYMRFRYDVRILYYPPSGPNIIPMIRDFVILILTRWLFDKTSFHFYASGISELYDTLGKISRIFFRLAYFKPDVAIRPSEFTICDGQILKAKKEYIIPFGLADHYQKFHRGDISQTSIPKILFVGVLKESKGALVLIEACNVLAKKGIHFTVELMGKFESPSFENCVKQRVAELSLDTHVDFLGVLTGDKKFQVFAKTDIFCFPTFFESEALPVVILEAMQFALPVVTTQWRGIPSIVEDGVSGYLVPTQDIDAVAEKLEQLIKHPPLARQMGERGREKFLEDYTIDKYRKRLVDVFLFAGKKNDNAKYKRTHVNITL